MVISILTAGLLTGCADKVNNAGKKTRQIDISWKNTCIFIANDEFYSAMKFGAQGNYDNVLNNIKNETARRGGNSYIINSFVNDGGGHYTARFEMFKCPETKYHVPKKYEALEKLKDLQDKGVITQEEYDIEKAKVLQNN